MHLDNFRICSPAETLKRVRPFFERLGITRLARQTGLDNIGIPVWSAFAPNAKAIVIAQGKGLDDEAAKTSAAMEAIERAVATQPACTTRTATRECLEAEGQVVDTLDSFLSPGKPPVAADEAIMWAQAKHLIDGHAVWVPFDAIHLDRTRPEPRYWISSDGLASGNTLDEALLHAMLERVERDALTLWHVTPQKRRYSEKIDLSLVEQEPLSIALGKVRGAGLDIALFDITTDVGVPCISALLAPSHALSGEPVRYIDLTMGAGSSTSATTAAMRAITEAVQSRMTFIAGSRDDLLPSLFSQRASSEMVQAMATKPTKTLEDIANLETQSTSQSLTCVLNKLKSAGMDQIYAVELGPDWLPANVVKVLAPQLENPEGERQCRFGSRALSRAF